MLIYHSLQLFHAILNREASLYRLASKRNLYSFVITLSCLLGMHHTDRILVDKNILQIHFKQNNIWNDKIFNQSAKIKSKHHRIKITPSTICTLCIWGLSLVLSVWITFGFAGIHPLPQNMVCRSQRMTVMDFCMFSVLE